MSTNTALHPIEKATNEEFEYYGSVLTTNTVLKAALILLALVIVALGFQIVRLSNAVVAHKPLVVRVGDVGRAEAVDFKYQDYTPQDGELKYFLSRFVTDFYGRNRATLATVYPKSLYFLSRPQFDMVDAIDRRSQWAAKYLTSDDDQVNIEVKNIGLDYSQKPIYRAQVEFSKVYLTTAGAEAKREPFIANIAFHLDMARPAAEAKTNPGLWANNPLGFFIDDFRADQGQNEEEK